MNNFSSNYLNPQKYIMDKRGRERKNMRDTTT